jgi:hypothetical protein
MSVASQYRSYLSWPTEALLVGPNTSSWEKWLAWASSFVGGMTLGIAWFGRASRGLFTAGAHEGFLSVFPTLAATLLVPLVIASLVLPRVGGPILVLASVASILCSIPASAFDLSSVGAVALLLYLPMLLVGLGFTWSG